MKKSTTERESGLKFELSDNMENPPRKRIFITLSGNSYSSVGSLTQANRLAHFLREAADKIESWAEESLPVKEG